MGTCFGTSVRFLYSVHGADGLSVIVHPMYGYNWHCSMTGHVRHAHTYVVMTLIKDGRTETVAMLQRQSTISSHASQRSSLHQWHLRAVLGFSARNGDYVGLHCTLSPCAACLHKCLSMPV